jgi:ankyrin repeat protein
MDKVNYLLVSGLLFCSASFAEQSKIHNLDFTKDYLSDSIKNARDLHDEEELLQIVQEALEQGANPIALAIKKDKVELAHHLLMIRKIDLALGLETFDFPGYRFTRPYGDSGEEAIVWVKKAPISLMNEKNEEVSFSEAKIDCDILKLLMKYDEQYLWHNEILEILYHAYQRCDLEGVLFCVQLASNLPNIDFKNEMTKPRYLIDPFLSDFPIDLTNPTHFYNDHGSPESVASIWDFRPDDNVIVSELKKQLQIIIGANAPIDKYQQQLDELKNGLQNLKEEMKEGIDECKTILADYQVQIDQLKADVTNLETQRKQDTEEYRQKIAELETKIKESKEIEDALITYGNNPEGLTSFHYAIKQGDLKTVKLLVSHGINCNSRDGGITALIRAVQFNRDEIAKILLENGADVNDVIIIDHVVSGNKEVTTQDALYYGAQSGTFEIIELLIKNGAIIDRFYGNLYPLHLAANKGNFEAIKGLITAGANINVVSRVDGYRPLDFAAEKLLYSDNPQNLELVKFLVQHDAYRSYKRYYGQEYGRVKCPVISGYLKSVNK